MSTEAKFGPQETYQQVFDTFGHELTYEFHQARYQERLFPVHEDGWGFRLTGDLEYSVSEARARTIAHQFKGVGTKWLIVATYDIAGISIQEALDDNSLRELADYAAKIRSEMQQWLGARL
jgi:hypothetical protein